MRNTFVAIPPCKCNLMYTFNTPFFSVKKTLKAVIDYARIAQPRHEIRSQLGEQFTEPIDAPDVTGYRLVDMLMSVTDPMHLLQTFAKDSCLRIVIAMTAFGMGLDCPNVTRIVHVDLPP